MPGMVAEQLLASWNTTPNHAAITDFVAAVTTEGGEGFVLPAERVAVFDNDGTLWSEKPIPIQLDFTLYRMAEQAESDRSLRDRQPYKAAVERDDHWLGAAMVKHYRGDDADMHTLLGAVERAFEGMTVDAFGAEVLTWFETAEHPVLKRPYLTCAFTPMVELLRYLEANGFTTYIASGGDRDFMRPFAETLYGIPPERVIGSALGLGFRMDDDGTDLLYKSKIEFFDDGPRSRSGSGAARAGARSWPAATRTGTSRCCASPGRPSDRRCGCSCGTTTPTASSPTTTAPRTPSPGLTTRAGTWSACATTGRRCSGSAPRAPRLSGIRWEIWPRELHWAHHRPRPENRPDRRA
jgi:phosphoglycolate phosphatase-like HAD superfamily hydrolase